MGPAVVIPTRGRPERLGRLLDALDREGAEEVVVVLDGADPAAEWVLAGRGPAVRVERHATPRGPAAARNTGWRAARAAEIAFTDDDCEPAPGWLAALAAVEGDVVCGRVEPHPAERARLGPFSRTLGVSQAGPWFPTANVRYPRALLERLGGFDEAFPFPAGEDTDLAWRALEAGATTAYAPDALVWHAVHELGPVGSVRHAARWSTAVRVVARHPGLRAHLHHRVFWKPSHEALLLAAAGLALAPRTRGLSLGAAIPYLRLRRGAAVAVDAAELLAMVRGSVRARTFLL
jgi:Glycosyl transferase family 2